jgi:Endonuclease-reverse transcriptase
VGIQIHGTFGTIQFINIYNNCAHNRVLDALQRYMQDPMTREYPAAPLRYMWQGDFNRHSPLWDKERNEHLFTSGAGRLVQPLFNLLGHYNMKMALLKDIPTLRAKATRNHTWPDNVFCLEELLDSFISCNTEPEKQPVKTDHYPIISTLDVTPNAETPKQQRNFWGTDWVEFRKTLSMELEDILNPEAYLMVAELNQAIHHLDQAIDTTISKHTPLTHPCPCSKRWWTKDLSKAKKEKERLVCQAYNKHTEPQHPIHEEARLACNKYSLQI